MKLPNSTIIYQMKTSFQTLGFIASLLALGLSMILWPDLFLFAKKVFLPEWAELLPSPIDAAKYLAFLCLIPVTITSKTTLEALKNISKVILIAAILPTLIFVFRVNPYEKYFVHNTLFQYIFVILWNCLLPAVILLVIKLFYEKISSHIAD